MELPCLVDGWCCHGAQSSAGVGMGLACLLACLLEAGSAMLEPRGAQMNRQSVDNSVGNATWHAFTDRIVAAPIAIAATAAAVAGLGVNRSLGSFRKEREREKKKRAVFYRNRSAPPLINYLEVWPAPHPSILTVRKRRQEHEL